MTLSNGTFMLVLTVGAALLALWLNVRLPTLAPVTLKRVVVHVAFALVSLQLIADVAGSVTLYVAFFGIVLPTLTYAFLTTIWFLRVAQQMLAGAR